MKKMKINIMGVKIVKKILKILSTYKLTIIVILWKHKMEWVPIKKIKTIAKINILINFLVLKKVKRILIWWKKYGKIITAKMMKKKILMIKLTELIV